MAADNNQTQTQPNDETGAEGANEEPSMFEEAKKLRDENTKILDEMKKERAKMEKLHGEMILGGGSRMAPRPPQKTANDIYKEETKKAFEGLGFSPLAE